MAKKAIFDKKNILVIGGAGFIGSHLCDELIKENKIICLDNFSTGDEENIKHLYQDSNFKFVNHDITQPIDLEKDQSLATLKVEFQGVQEIYFLASPTSPKAYTQKPIETLLVNSVGLQNALDLAVKYKAKFFYASSAAVYGAIKGLVKEDYVGAVDQLGPRACYAEAKRFGETLVKNYADTYNLKTTMARIFNAYGPRMKLDDGRMIPEMVATALSKGDNVIIRGGKADRGSYLYVTDLIQAIIKLMKSSESGPMNLGSDDQIKFSEVAKKIIAVVGSSSGLEFKEPANEMAIQAIPNISLAKEKLGWFPIVLLDEGLKKTIEQLSAQKGVLEPEQFS